LGDERGGEVGRSVEVRVLLDGYKSWRRVGAGSKLRIDGAKQLRDTA